MNVLSRAKTLVQVDGGIVSSISLHEYDVRPALPRDALQLVDRARRNAAAAMLLRDGQVVNVDLASLALELPQLVGGEPADDLIAVAGHDDDEGRRGEEGLQVASDGIAPW